MNLPQKGFFFSQKIDTCIYCFNVIKLTFKVLPYLICVCTPLFENYKSNIY